MPAPVVLFCFNRPDHLRTTLNHLAQCSLASETVLYCYSDGPRLDSDSDSQKVNMAREVLREFSGFKDVIIIESAVNKGLARSVVEGVTEVVNSYGRVIVLEDDLQVSKDFLEFMNSALEKYQSNKSIGSISGYSFQLEKIIPMATLIPVQRASSWGWATWSDRWGDVDWELSGFDERTVNVDDRAHLAAAGLDQFPMLVKKKKGEIQSWAIAWTYHHVVQKMYCLVPTVSKVRNIGTDGTGTNFTTTTRKYETQLSEKVIQFPSKPFPSVEANAFIRDYFKPSFIRKLINFLKYSIWY